MTTTRPTAHHRGGRPLACGHVAVKPRAVAARGGHPAVRTRPLAARAGRPAAEVLRAWRTAT
ncbi:hypothetical protein, partial [Streptomyces sp.]|uniref:hypothetical protein n=1 Tax=Streptomyces sp. TaxID=1931 RepID=UPI0028114782